MNGLVRIEDLKVVNNHGDMILGPWDGFRAILVMSVICQAMLSL